MASTPQQVYVVNKLRPAGDRLGKAYVYFKALQVEYTANGWGSLFANTATPIDDGAAQDGRPVLTEANVLAFFTLLTAYITFMEQTGAANLNLVLKVGPNAEQV